MLTTISILVILLAVASPGLASLVAANSLSAAQSGLAASMMLARSEAVKRGVQAGVAATAPLSGNEFTGGWVVFIDANLNGRYDPQEVIVREQSALPADVRVSTASGATAVVFSPRGFLATQSAVDLSICRVRPVSQTGGTGSTPASSAGKGYRILIEPVGLADVGEMATCS